MLYRSYYVRALACMVIITAQARELRTPLDALYAPFHRDHPLGNETCDNVMIQGAAYYRCADRAFTNDHGTQTTNYASLYFGKEDFVGEEAFFSQDVFVPTNPWLNTATMSPRITYHEKGILFGFDYNCKRDNCTGTFGVRARLPFRIISLERFKKCGQLHDELGAGNLDELVEYKLEQFADANNNPRTIVTFAYRLDLLSNLIFNGATPGSTLALVNYQAPITMAGRNASRQGLGTPVSPFRYPLFVIKRNDGSAPTGTFGQFENDNFIPNTMKPTELNASGTNLQNNERGFFLGTTDYSPLGNTSAAQRMLWVVPGIERQAAAINLSPEADNLRTTVNDLLQAFDDSAEDFFTEQGLCFADYHKSGIGDLDLEFYYGDQLLCDLWGEILIGIKFPTAKKLKNPQELFAQPLGNNGHFETRLGGKLWYNTRDWLQLKGYASYNFVCQGTETINAPFKGATIKNIGPMVDARISWGYFFGYLNAVISNPSHPCSGFSIGYELYAKRKDNVELTRRELKDFFGVIRELDATIVEQNTHAITHKVTTEFFYETNMFDVWAGWTHAFAGKNAPKESDFYIGMTLIF